MSIPLLVSLAFADSVPDTAPCAGYLRLVERGASPEALASARASLSETDLACVEGRAVPEPPVAEEPVAAVAPPAPRPRPLPEGELSADSVDCLEARGGLAALADGSKRWSVAAACSLRQDTEQKVNWTLMFMGGRPNGNVQTWSVDVVRRGKHAMSAPEAFRSLGLEPEARRASGGAAAATVTQIGLFVLAGGALATGAYFTANSSSVGQRVFVPLACVAGALTLVITDVALIPVWSRARMETHRYDVHGRFVDAMEEENERIEFVLGVDSTTRPVDEEEEEEEEEE